jgi:uncharacterized protein (TIGR03545 family)
MRWKGFIALAVIVAAWLLVTSLFLDKWIENGIEAAGEAAAGAKVEIDGLDFRFSDLSIQWQRFQAADSGQPMRNLVETGRTAFKLNPAALFRKRIVIDEMALEGVRSGTPRTTSGELQKKPPKPKTGKPDYLDKIKTRLKNEVDLLPIMKFDPAAFKKKLNLDSLIAIAAIRTPQRVDSVKKDAMAAAARWDGYTKTFRPDEDLKKIQSDFQGIDPQKVKTIPEALELVEKARTAQKSLKAISDSFAVRQKEIRADIGRIMAYPAQADDWIREDYRSVAQKAKLPDLSVRSIAKMLAGRAIVAKADQVLGYYQAVRKYLPRKSDKPEKKIVPRFKGQDIHYAERHAYPTFLIRAIRVSGQTGSSAEQPGVMLKGEILNVTSQPWVIGKPMTVDLSGMTQDLRSVAVQAVLDHVTEAASDSFHVRFGNVSLNRVAIPDSKYLPAQIQTGKADFDLVLRFKENDFLSRFDMQARDLAFDFGQMQSKDLFVDIVRRVIGQMGLITLDVRAAGKQDEFQFNVNSNIDDLVSQELRKIGSQALADAEAKIRSRLDQIKVQKLAELEKLYADRMPAIEASLGKYGKLIGDNKSLLDGKLDGLLKEIEKRKKGEENKLKDKARGLLDGVLKN